MITLKKVTKDFGKKTALDGVSFDVDKGEIVGFLGPNGAGKTTTMRLIVGYLAPTEGNISINGKDPSVARIETLQQIGYLPENNPLYGEMKVQEYLDFIAKIKGGSYEQYLEVLALEEVLGQKIEQLSRGWRQRVGLAAALIGDPSILVLDEPTSGLDPLEQEKIRHFISSLAGIVTVILSTHILSEVEDIATRLIIINNGRIVYDGKKPGGTGAVEKLFRKYVT